MKRNRNLLRKAIACFLATIAFVLVIAPTASAYEATNYTYTISAEGEWLRTQDAYLASGVLLKEAKLSDPRDVVVRNNKIYVADSGNSRLYVYDINTGVATDWGVDVLKTPSGVFVHNDGSVYVADVGAAAVFKFDANGALLTTYGRPKEATFGKNTQYIPSKIAVNDAGILYIVSDGSFDGIVQLDSEGHFLGYFGYNNIPLTITEYLQDIFFTEEQKDKLFDRKALAFGNIGMDKKGLVYSVTQAVEGSAVKRHNVSGQNLLPVEMDDEMNFVDVTIGSFGQIYAITETGLLFEYDTDGNLLFSSGGLAISTERSGLISAASSVAADEYGNVYILDSIRGLLHILSPTAMASSVHSAMDKYNQGYYEESKDIWEQVSLIIGNSRISENGIANCLFQLQDYEGAADHYYIAENRVGYSDAYWQIRSDQVTVILPYALGVLVVLIILFFIYSKYREKHPKKQRNKSKLEKDLLLVFSTIRHPIDTFYSIRRENAGSFLSATILYVIAFAVFIANFILRGFVVSMNTPRNTSIVYVAVLFLIPVSLFIISNFFVGEINESEARFRDIYVASAYVAAPFVVIIPFIVGISHFLTLAESSLLGLASIAIYAWIAVLLWISTKEIHAYTVPKTIANLLLTIFLMAVFIIAAALVIMFWDQLIDFLYSVIREAKYRVS